MKGFIKNLKSLVCICIILWIVLPVTSEMIFSDMSTVSGSPKVHPPNGTRYYTFQVGMFDVVGFRDIVVVVVVLFLFVILKYM